MASVIYADRALTPLEEIRDAVVVVEGSKIAAIGPRGGVRVPPGAQEHSARGMTIVPGFVDVHIHCAGGRDVMEGTADVLEAVAAAVARMGPRRSWPPRQRPAMPTWFCSMRTSPWPG